MQTHSDAFCPIDHICIDTADIFGLIDFFQQVFGMSVTRTKGPAENPEGVWLDGGVQLQAAAQPAKDCGRCHHIAFQCRDLDAVLDRAKAFGAVPVEGRPRHWFQAMGIVFEMKIMN